MKSMDSEVFRALVQLLYSHFQSPFTTVFIEQQDNKTKTEPDQSRALYHTLTVDRIKAH